jgi:hypothetical protein
MSEPEFVSPWEKRRARVLEALRLRLAEQFGVTVSDPFVTVRFKDPESGRDMSVTMLASETRVHIPRPGPLKKGEAKEAKKRREKVRLARVTDDWASPSGPGGWLCPKSATGYCWYDDEIDPLNDHCMDCGFPRERK